MGYVFQLPFFFQFLIIVAVIAAFCAATAFADGPGCCSPIQWEGNVWGFSERRNASFFEYLYYDYLNKRIRADVFVDEIGRNQQIRATVYEQFVKGLFTRFIVDSTGKCTVQKPRMPYLPEACVPPNYEHDTVWTLGALLKVHSYFYNFNRAQEFADVMVGEMNCVPIRGIVFSHHEEFHGPDFAVNYFNIQLGIANPSVLNLPGNCQALLD